MLHGKDSLDSLLYSVCYAVPFEKLQKIWMFGCWMTNVWMVNLEDKFRG